MGALANPEVGKFINEYFCSAYQKVATFKIVGAQKQGGNVASYFCAPDGRVLHCVAGPVDAGTFLREAKWVVDTTKKAMEVSKNDGGKFKAYFRTAHADKLRQDFGVIVSPATFDPPDPQDPERALTYKDPTGRPLAPILPPPPIDGPDVTLNARKAQAEAAAAPGNRALADGKGGRVWLTNVGVVHQLMAAHSMVKIEKVYGSVFENILGEKITTKPVEIVKPFTWVNEGKNAVRPEVPLDRN